MSDIKEIANPSDKITIDCSDIDAARVAVLLLGRGWYKIIGDDMPLLAMGDCDEWAKKVYGKTLNDFIEGVSRERVAAALESVSLVGERTSLNDIVKMALAIAFVFRDEKK